MKFKKSSRAFGLCGVVLSLGLGFVGCSNSGTNGDNPDGGGNPDGSSSGPCTPGDTGLAATQRDCRYFPDSAPWNRDVTRANPAADSAAITSWMEGFSPPNGFGGGGRIRIDFSIAAMEVPAGTAKVPFQTVAGFFYNPDCDRAPVPLVAGGAVEDYPNHVGYTCSGFNAGEDCHILLVSRSEKRLYEMYHATDAGGTFRSGCLAIWDMNMTDVNGRGQQCTGADAAGFPMSALLFTPEEVQAGAINHAIRFILPNNMIRMRKYVQPATHGTDTTGPATSGPYGFRMRLKSTFNVASLKPAAQVIARALQKYGMLMSDGGNLALTAQSDVLSTVKWSTLDLQAGDLGSIKASDFDVIEYETPTDVTNNCMHTPLTN